jgi:hypothetical protein
LLVRCPRNIEAAFLFASLRFTYTVLGIILVIAQSCAGVFPAVTLTNSRYIYNIYLDIHNIYINIILAYSIPYISINIKVCIYIIPLFNWYIVSVGAISLVNPDKNGIWFLVVSQSIFSPLLGSRRKIAALSPLNFRYKNGLA